MHQLKVFCDQLYGKDRNACDVAARSCEAIDEANFDWVGTDKKTIGIVWVTVLAASAPGVLAPTTTMTTPRRTKSGQCRQPIVVTLRHRYSTARLRPSTNPASPKPR